MYLIYSIIRMSNNKKYNTFYIFPIVIFSIITLLLVWFSLYGVYPCPECGGEISDVAFVFIMSIPIYICLNIEYITLMLIYKDRNRDVKLERKHIICFWAFLFILPILLLLLATII